MSAPLTVDTTVAGKCEAWSAPGVSAASTSRDHNALVRSLNPKSAEIPGFRPQPRAP